MWDDYAKSIGTTSANLTTEQKIQAEVNGILEETKFQTGDAAKVAGTYSGQVSMLSFNFQQLKVAVGNALIPIARAVLPGINAIISGLTTLANVFAKVSSLLFGGTGGASSQVTVQKEIASSGIAAANATDELSSATQKAGSAAKKAEKDIKGVQSSFDDLNVLALKTADSLGSAAGGMDMSGSSVGVPEIDIPGIETDGELFADAEVSPELLASIEILRQEFEWLKETAGRIWAVFSESWSANGAAVIEAAKGAFSSVYESIKSIADAFANVWTNGTGAEILNSIYEIITNTLTRVSALSEKFREAWEANGNGEAILQSILNIVQSIVGFFERLSAASLEWAQNLDLEPLMTAFRGLLDAIDPLVATITDDLAWAYENVLLPFRSWFWEELAPVAIDLLTSAIDALNSVLETLEPLATWLWETFLQPLAEWTGDIVIAALETVTDLLEKFSDWISENEELVQNIAIVVGTFAAAWGLVNTAIGIWNAIYGFAIAGAWGLADAVTFLLSPIGLVILAIGAVIAIVVLLVKNWDKVKEVAANVWQAIKDAWNKAGEWFNTNVVEPIAGFFSGLWDGIKTAASNAWAGIKEVFSNVAEWFTEHVIDPVKNGFKDFINRLIGFVEGFANFFIRGINAIIGAFNKISFSTPDWLPVIGGKTFGFNLQPVAELNLPRLAQGAVIPPNREFLAVLGDQRSGTNIEAPADLIEQIVTRAMQRVVSAGGGSRDLTVVMELDRRELGRVVYRLNNEESQRVGVNFAR